VLGANSEAMGTAAAISGAGDAALVGVAGVSKWTKQLQIYSVTEHGVLLDASLKGEARMSKCKGSIVS